MEVVVLVKDYAGRMSSSPTPTTLVPSSRPEAANFPFRQRAFLSHVQATMNTKLLSIGPYSSKFFRNFFSLLCFSFHPIFLTFFHVSYGYGLKYIIYLTISPFPATSGTENT